MTNCTTGITCFDGKATFGPLLGMWSILEAFCGRLSFGDFCSLILHDTL